MKVYCEVKAEYRRKTQAYFYANHIELESKNKVVFIDSNGTRTTVFKKDLISIEKDND